MKKIVEKNCEIDCEKLGGNFVKNCGKLEERIA